jgi:hypothetical protein
VTACAVVRVASCIDDAVADPDMPRPTNKENSS